MPQVSVEVSPNAARNLERLRLFLHEKNPVAARRAADVLKHALRQLAQFPACGKPDPDDDGSAELRELVVPFGAAGYRIRYRYSEGGAVMVLAVRHQREAGFPGE